jgi:sterol desaturase/sphingolipid hydroxylase (fatty acid hydroxylase superfamily)
MIFEAASTALLRLLFFAGIFFAMAAWETLAPLRPLRTPRFTRWSTNLVLAAIDTVLLRLLLPAAAVGVAWLAAERHWGLLNQAALPSWSAVPITVIALDLVLYMQHVLFHRIPMLWRLHQVHHTDLDFDVTTGVRFHPLEILLSMLVKSSAILVLGPPAGAVLLFEVLLNATSMFNHGNVRVPALLDRSLRLLLVTPDMHRVHHSVEPAETGSNFGFNLPWWDRILGTYRGRPQAGHQEMSIGLREFRDAEKLTLFRLLALPFAHGERRATRLQA